MNIPFASNRLYYGDCLDIIAGFLDSCIDLIYLDPPFNSNEKYNKVFKDSGRRIDLQIKVFDDVWLWDNTFRKPERPDARIIYQTHVIIIYQSALGLNKR